MASIGLKVSANDEEMTFSLERPSGKVASIIISTEDAAQIAGNVLEAQGGLRCNRQAASA